MRLHPLFAVTATTALILGCTPEHRSSAEDHARDVNAINEVLAAHIAAVNTGDSAANLAGFADDLVYLPPDMHPIFGKEALASLIGPFVSAFDASLEMVAEETVVSGDWAFQWGNLTNTIVSHESSDTTAMSAKWLYLYERQSDGRWKIARDIYNSNPPSP